MRAALKAIAEHLQSELDELSGARIVVHRDYAYAVAAPYVVLQAPAHPTHDEESLNGPDLDESGGFFRATSVHANADGARWVADRVRSVLSPGMGPALIVADSRQVETVWDGSLGDVVVDRDVTLPNSNTHPAVALDEYEFTATPLAES